MDHDAAAALRGKLRGLIQAGAHVTLFLDRVTYLDTAGIAVLVEATRWAKERNACMTLAHPSKAVRGALEVARLREFFPTSPGVA